MLSPTAPLVLPTCEENCSTSDKSSSGFTRRHGVILISVLEMLGCIAAAVLYIYALSTEPPWAKNLVPLPDGLCSAINIVHGVMYIVVLISLMEFCLAIFLLNGARQENLNAVQFWIHSMLTYLALVSIVVVGMELARVRSPTMNSVAFLNVFLRFLELMIVYAWSEQESMKRLKKRRLSRQASTNTIATIIEPLTPPPSYDSTIPSGTMSLIPAPPSTANVSFPSPRPSTSAAAQRNDIISPANQQPETVRTKRWRKQWE